MFALRLLRRRREKKPVNLKLLVCLAAAILAVFLFMRFFDWIDNEQRSLLPVTESLTILDNLEALDAIAPTPTNTFGAELYTAGIYRNAVGEIPIGTVVVVYVKNNWRFVEVDYLPGRTTTEYLATHLYQTQEIKLDQERSVWIQTIDHNPRCIDYDDDVPNRCEISRHLIADLDGRLLLIAADGNHATDGELIELARSILSVDGDVSQ